MTGLRVPPGAGKAAGPDEGAPARPPRASATGQLRPGMSARATAATAAVVATTRPKASR